MASSLTVVIACPLCAQEVEADASTVLSTTREKNKVTTTLNYSASTDHDCPNIEGP